MVVFRMVAASWAFLLVLLAGVPAAEAQVGACSPLPVAAGKSMTVGSVDELANAVRTASAGTTILLRDGTYQLTAPLIFRVAGVTLRSASGRARAAVLDAEYKVGEPIYIEASDVTIADITIARAKDHHVHLVPPARRDIRNIRLRGLRLIDGGEQFVKANPDAARTAFVDDVIVECSEFRMTEAGRPNIESLGGTQCYTGGVDVHAGRGWQIRRNHFEGIFCRTGFFAEHAVHMWMDSRDTVVEHNTIINCARGIGFGLGASNPHWRAWPDAGPDYAGHVGGLIRNNVIYADVPEYDTGIGLEQARDVRVIHNTVFATRGATRAFSSIDARFRNTRAVIQNNLVNNITLRAGPAVNASNNIEGASADDFVDAARHDLHLRAGSRAIDAGATLADAGVDIDGEGRGEKPDVGADERIAGTRTANREPRTENREPEYEP